MTKISSSPGRNTFQKENYIKRVEEDDKEPDQDYLEMFTTAEERKREREADPEWQKDNLEWDLRTTDWILAKVRASEVYAQNLYAALCNNEFQKRDVMPILKDQTWSCSWRYAGGIIADMREQGDYIDWYCSGIGANDDGFVPESCATMEIIDDLKRLGWNIILDNNGDIWANKSLQKPNAFVTIESAVENNCTYFKGKHYD